MNTGNKILGKYTKNCIFMEVLYRHPSIKKYCVTRKFDVLVVQNSLVVVQNNDKGKTKKRAARANLLFAN